MQVAQRIANVLDTTVADPQDAVISPDEGSMMIGIGSGIYWGRFHSVVRHWVRNLPKDAGSGHQAFIFSTSGLPFLAAFYHLPLKRALRKKGFSVIGEFCCRGHDTFGPLWLFGGLNRKHPNDSDLQRAEEFARQLSGRSHSGPR